MKFLIVFCIVQFSFLYSDVPLGIYDKSEVKDSSTLETKVLQDWKISKKDPAIRQKLIEITVCEWWPGQKVRLPITLIAPAKSGVCKNILVGNMGLNLKPAFPNPTYLKLVKDKGVGLVLVGMSTIDAMEPKGKLHLGMKEWLIKTKNARHSPAWIWGMSDMRALTAALEEKKVFELSKVMVTGGSKRGVGAAICGIYDDRFTAILPVVAPPLGIPGGSFVIGLDDPIIVKANQEFLDNLKAGKVEGLPETTYQALTDRKVRRELHRIPLDHFKAADWSDKEIETVNKKVWAVCHVTDHLEMLKRKGTDVFYNVGTNDSVTPELLELGQKFPEFRLYIVPGGQHGGPKGAGYTRRVPMEKEVLDNLLAFSEFHFFNQGVWPKTPKAQYKWNEMEKVLEVTIVLDEEVDILQNQLSWTEDRHKAFELELEYDKWETVNLVKTENSKLYYEIKPKRNAKRLDFTSSHTVKMGDAKLTISSPLISVLLDL